MIGPSVDLETVNSIHKKRLLAFVNHFVISTTSFLNTISKSCEQKFMALENKIQKLEASIIILESKLNSVPGLKEEVANVLTEETETPVVTEPEEVKPEETAPEPAQAELSPELMKYVKMLQFGVPAQAVRLKLSQDSVDPALHEEILNYNKSTKGAYFFGIACSIS